MLDSASSILHSESHVKRGPGTFLTAWQPFSPPRGDSGYRDGKILWYAEMCRSAATRNFGSQEMKRAHPHQPLAVTICGLAWPTFILRSLAWQLTRTSWLSSEIHCRRGKSLPDPKWVRASERAELPFYSTNPARTRSANCSLRSLLIGLILCLATSLSSAQDKPFRDALERWEEMYPPSRTLAMYQLDWEDSLDAARQRARQEQRPICLFIIHAKYGDIRSGHC